MGYTSDTYVHIKEGFVSQGVEWFKVFHIAKDELKKDSLL